MIVITTQLSIFDFIIGSLLLAYRKPLYAFLTLGVLITLLIDVVLILSPSLKGEISMIPGILFLLFIPSSVIFSAVRLYRSNTEYRKQILYSFDSDHFEAKTDKIASKVALSVLPKVMKTGNWLFVYHNANSANVIPLRDISDEQLAQLKALLSENGVKNNL